MRLRILLLTCGLALCASASAAAYPWPLKPFNKQHPIRANFGDPRTRFLNTMLTDGLQGPGPFLFHNGIDIAAPPGTPVYPVISGKVHYIDDAAVSVKTKGHGVFQYFHLAVTVPNGQHVIAGQRAPVVAAVRATAPETIVAADGRHAQRFVVPLREQRRVLDRRAKTPALALELRARIAVQARVDERRGEAQGCA